MASVVMHFLLVFDHSKAQLICEREFGTDLAAAVRAYGKMEKEHRDNSDIDILLVGSDSLETVKVTHANYFDGTAALAKPTPSKYRTGLCAELAEGPRR